MVNSLETTERKIQEFERYANDLNSVIPKDWHRDSSSRRRTDEDTSLHELA